MNYGDHTTVESSENVLIFKKNITFTANMTHLFFAAP